MTAPYPPPFDAPEDTIQTLRSVARAAKARVDVSCRTYRGLGGTMARRGRTPSELDDLVQDLLHDVGMSRGPGHGPGWWALAGKYSAALIEGYVVATYEFEGGDRR